MDDVRPESSLARFVRFLKAPLEASLCILLVAIVLLIFLQVLFRYLIHTSLAWTEELVRIFFLWLASLASAYAFKTKSHFALRFLVERFGKRAQRIIADQAAFFTSVFLILFIWKAMAYTWNMAGQVAPSTQISMAFLYSSAVVGGILMLYYFLAAWWAERKAGNAPDRVK